VTDPAYYRDNRGVEHPLETEAGSGATQRTVHGLPADIAQNLADTATRTEQCRALLATISSSVDGLEGYTDQLEALLTTLQGYVDGLEGLITSSNTALAQLHTDFGPGAPKIDQVGSIGTSADVQFATQTLTKGMSIKNVSTGGQTLYIKHSAGPTSSNSLLLAPGEWSDPIECTNANQVYMRASASGGAAAYSGR
jgi:hypothetical protein